MPRVTKKELQEQLEQADRVIDMQQQKIQELQQQQEDILNDKGVISKQEFDGICNELKRVQINYKMVTELYNKYKEKNSTLINKCAELAKENKELKSNIVEENECGLERKSILSLKNIKRFITANENEYEGIVVSLKSHLSVMLKIIEEDKQKLEEYENKSQIYYEERDRLRQSIKHDERILKEFDNIFENMFASEGFKIIVRHTIEFAKNKNVKKHNERGAGRKSNLTEAQKNKIQKLHQEGLSYGAIAKEVGLSKAYVYKLINKHNEFKE